MAGPLDVNSGGANMLGAAGAQFQGKLAEIDLPKGGKATPVQGEHGLYYVVHSELKDGTKYTFTIGVNFLKNDQDFGQQIDKHVANMKKCMEAVNRSGVFAKFQVENTDDGQLSGSYVFEGKQQAAHNWTSFDHLVEQKKTFCAESGLEYLKENNNFETIQDQAAFVLEDEKFQHELHIQDSEGLLKLVRTAAVLDFMTTITEVGVGALALPPHSADQAAGNVEALSKLTEAKQAIQSASSGRPPVKAPVAVPLVIPEVQIGVKLAALISCQEHLNQHEKDDLKKLREVYSQMEGLKKDEIKVKQDIEAVLEKTVEANSRRATLQKQQKALTEQIKENEVRLNREMAPLLTKVREAAAPQAPLSQPHQQALDDITKTLEEQKKRIDKLNGVEPWVFEAYNQRVTNLTAAAGQYNTAKNEPEKRQPLSDMRESLESAEEELKKLEKSLILPLPLSQPDAQLKDTRRVEEEKLHTAKEKLGKTEDYKEAMRAWIFFEMEGENLDRESKWIEYTSAVDKLDSKQTTLEEVLEPEVVSEVKQAEHLPEAAPQQPVEPIPPPEDDQPSVKKESGLKRALTTAGNVLKDELRKVGEGLKSVSSKPAESKAAPAPATTFHSDPLYKEAREYLLVHKDVEEATKDFARAFRQDVDLREAREKLQTAVKNAQSIEKGAFFGIEGGWKEHSEFLRESVAAAKADRELREPLNELLRAAVAYRDDDQAKDQYIEAGRNFEEAKYEIELTSKAKSDEGFFANLVNPPAAEAVDDPGGAETVFEAAADVAGHPEDPPAVNQAKPEEAKSKIDMKNDPLLVEARGLAQHGQVRDAMIAYGEAMAQGGKEHANEEKLVLERAIIIEKTKASAEEGNFFVTVGDADWAAQNKILQKALADAKDYKLLQEPLNELLLAANELKNSSDDNYLEKREAYDTAVSSFNNLVNPLGAVWVDKAVQTEEGQKVLGTTEKTIREMQEKFAGFAEDQETMIKICGELRSKGYITEKEYTRLISERKELAAQARTIAGLLEGSQNASQVETVKNFYRCIPEVEKEMNLFYERLSKKVVLYNRETNSKMAELMKKPAVEDLLHQKDFNPQNQNSLNAYFIKDTQFGPRIPLLLREIQKGQDKVLEGEEGEKKLIRSQLNNIQETVSWCGAFVNERMGSDLDAPGSVDVDTPCNPNDTVLQKWKDGRSEEVKKSMDPCLNSLYEIAKELGQPDKFMKIARLDSAIKLLKRQLPENGLPQQLESKIQQLDLNDIDQVDGQVRELKKLALGVEIVDKSKEQMGRAQEEMGAAKSSKIIPSTVTADRTKDAIKKEGLYYASLAWITSPTVDIATSAQKKELELVSIEKLQASQAIVKKEIENAKENLNKREEEHGNIKKGKTGTLAQKARYIRYDKSDLAASQDDLTSRRQRIEVLAEQEQALGDLITKRQELEYAHSSDQWANSNLVQNPHKELEPLREEIDQALSVLSEEDKRRFIVAFNALNTDQTVINLIKAEQILAQKQQKLGRKDSLSPGIKSQATAETNAVVEATKSLRQKIASLQQELREAVAEPEL